MKPTDLINRTKNLHTIVLSSPYHYQTHF